MRMGEEERDAQQRKEREEEEHVQQRRRPEKETPLPAVGDKGEMKEAWRKSDSTIGHHTIRPGAMSASRASRPVSMAESVQSTHTIVPGSKRLSALITDADFGMLEEDGDDLVFEGGAFAPPETHLFDTSAAALRARDRRSMSLNLGVHNPRPQIATSAPSAAELKHPSHSISEGVLPPVSSPPTLDYNSYNPSLKLAAPVPASGGFRGSNIRGQFSAWTTSNTPISAPIPITTRQESHLQGLPQSAISPPSSGGNSFRQTAISMTSGFAPAAGLAKKAMEKMGRKWGMGMNSSSSGSGHSSSASLSSSNAPSSYSSTSHTDYGLARTSSNQSTPSVNVNMHLLQKGKRTPNAPSGSYSVSSSSDSDAFFSHSEPVMGKLVRGPMRSSGGVVFGRNLEVVVRETAIDVGGSGDESSEDWEAKYRELETRMLPALVARCAQHLLIWGVQEEGLFRVNGRPAHVSKLRAEFDTGVDYDMTDCDPGDIDPHAVASVFRAFLRELPEPILTNHLLPYFDAAIIEESNSNLVDPLPTKKLPAIRKPPSLSTLALPSFQDMRPPSKTLLNAIKSLIHQLPPENRDLIRTVVDLIKATAGRSKETKMPLSNLLLVFCPSLSMSPPLLKVLCDGEGIWGSSPVIDFRRESLVLDIRASGSTMSDDDTDEDSYSDAMEERSWQSMDRDSTSDNPSSDYHASAEEEASLLEEGEHAQQHRRFKEVERPEVPTLYLDAHSRCSSSSPSSAIDNGSMSSGKDSVNIANSPSPPPLSSSAESVATPTSSGHPSFSHLPLEEVKGKVEPQHRQRSASPQIAGPSPLAISKRPLISSPIPASASTPVSFPYQSSERDSRRRSIPILSLPSFTPYVTEPPSPAGSNSPRLKGRKPSLRKLFSKRSAGSLGPGNSFISSPILREGSPYLQPRAASDSSISTPRSAVTASQGSSTSSTYLLPVLDTPIEAGPSLRFGLGIEESPPCTADGTKKMTSPSSSDGNSSPVISEDQDTKGPDHRPSFPVSSSQSSLILPGQDHIRPNPTRARLVSTASSNHLGFPEDEDEGVEDWTQSVLLAAAGDGSWKISAPGQA